MTFGGEMGKFLASGVGTPAPPASRENPVVFPPKKKQYEKSSQW